MVLDSFYLLTQDACNYGSINSPKRVLRVAPENPDHPGDADEIDWTRDGLDVVQGGTGCVVDGASSLSTHLTPTGDAFTAVVQTSASLTPRTISLPNHRFDVGFDAVGDDIWYITMALEIKVWSISANAVDATRGFGSHASNPSPVAVQTTDDYVYVADNDADSIFVYDRSGTLQSSKTITLDGSNGSPVDFFLTDTHAYVVESSHRGVFAYRLSDGAYVSGLNLYHDGYPVFGIDYDGTYTYYLAYQGATPNILIAPGLTSINDARSAGTLLVRPVLQNEDAPATIDVVNGRTAYVATFGDQLVYDLGTAANDYTWVPAEDVFTAQEQLVTLLAVIAAIGMPIGAMTAIVFFGQAVISSGIGGQGASQVMVAIAAVVVILVSIQMFQQFAGFLGTAFDAVNGDRFVVFDETLGSLAETIAEFWGVLAFAGFINIASIVWRNYSGNFSIGGTQGGL